jgi:hypothetical protein
MPKRITKTRPAPGPQAETINARHRPQPVASLLSPEQMEKIAQERLERMERFETLWDPDQGAESFMPKMARLGRIFLGLSYFLNDDPTLDDVIFLDKLLAAYVDSGGGSPLDMIALEILAGEDTDLFRTFAHAVIDRKRREAHQAA